MSYNSPIPSKLLNISIKYNNDIYKTPKMSFVSILVGDNLKENLANNDY
jgi:hypothetical protein